MDPACCIDRRLNTSSEHNLKPTVNAFFLFSHQKLGTSAILHGPSDSLIQTTFNFIITNKRRKALDKLSAYTAATVIG
jgi:hypothetical protein